MCTISTNSWAGVVLINCHSAASSPPVLPLPQSQITKMGFILHKCKLRSQNLYVNDQMLFYLGINGCDGYHHCIMIPVLFSPSFRAESTPRKNLQIGNFWLLLWPPPPPPCIGYRTISFLVKIQSPFLCSEMAQLDHLGHFMQHLKNKMGIFLFQVWKKWISKTEKMRKWPKTANFGHILVFLSD